MGREEVKMGREKEDRKGEEGEKGRRRGTGRRGKGMHRLRNYTASDCRDGLT